MSETHRLTRSISPLDQLLGQLNRGLRTCTPGATTSAAPSPAEPVMEQPLTTEERHHAVGLMRVNHTGEVCAQALYDGQAATARNAHVKAHMRDAAQEEEAHLSWCEQRLNELGGRTSHLNPLFYALSFSLGAATGAVGDRVSLGFVEATEDQVSRHLDQHLSGLPDNDDRSRAIVRQMLADEQRHGAAALSAGGRTFPRPVKRAMTGLSRLMTQVVYYG